MLRGGRRVLRRTTDRLPLAGADEDSQAKSFADGVDSLAAGGDDSERDERTAVNHRLAVYKDLVLAVAPVNGVDVNLQFPPELGRHTDSVKAGDSECAVANH